MINFSDPKAAGKLIENGHSLGELSDSGKSPSPTTAKKLKLIQQCDLPQTSVEFNQVSLRDFVPRPARQRVRTRPDRDKRLVQKDVIHPRFRHPIERFKELDRMERPPSDISKDQIALRERLEFQEIESKSRKILIPVYRKAHSGANHVPQHQVEDVFDAALFNYLTEIVTPQKQPAKKTVAQIEGTNLFAVYEPEDWVARKGALKLIEKGIFHPYRVTQSRDVVYIIPVDGFGANLDLILGEEKIAWPTIHNLASYPPLDMKSMRPIVDLDSLKDDRGLGSITRKQRSYLSRIISEAREPSREPLPYQMIDQVFMAQLKVYSFLQKVARADFPEIKESAVKDVRSYPHLEMPLAKWEQLLLLDIPQKDWDTIRDSKDRETLQESRDHLFSCLQLLLRMRKIAVTTRGSGANLAQLKQVVVYATPHANVPVVGPYRALQNIVQWSEIKTMRDEMLERASVPSRKKKSDKVPASSNASVADSNQEEEAD